jgi:hypothetical protein
MSDDGLWSRRSYRQHEDIVNDDDSDAQRPSSVDIVSLTCLLTMRYRSPRGQNLYRRDVEEYANDITIMDLRDK